MSYAQQGFRKWLTEYKHGFPTLEALKAVISKEVGIFHEMIEWVKCYNNVSKIAGATLHLLHPFFKAHSVYLFCFVCFCYCSEVQNIGHSFNAWCIVIKLWGRNNNAKLPINLLKFAICYKKLQLNYGLKLL